MTAEPSDPPPGQPDLDFDAPLDAKPSAPPVCSQCLKPLSGSYYSANGGVLCSACGENLTRTLADGVDPTRLIKATAFGLVGGAIGSGIYYAILAITGYEIGLVAILVGYLVGRGMQMGSGGQGGWAYQAIAVALTYVAIVVTYIPMILRAFREAQIEPPLGTLFLIAIKAPVMAGVENIIGMLIIGFALFQAWKMTRRVEVAVTGPFAVNHGASV